METRANHLWVGVVSLLLLAALAGAIVWLARLNTSNQDEYDIFFKQAVDGLAKGSAVAFSGVPAGQVESINLWTKDPEYVRVRVRIDNDIPILRGTTATVQGSFTGVSTISLDGAVKGAPPIVAAGPEGVPVIPTKPGGLGEILANAPLLLERLATLTERLTLLLSDRNQASIAGILDNTEKMSGTFADAAPQVERTLDELQATLRQANGSLASFERVMGSTDNLLNKDGASVADELRVTLKSAQGAADELKGTLVAARPVTRQLTESTLPAAEATLRDLRATSKALRGVTEKIENEGATSLISGQKLPDYEP